MASGVEPADRSGRAGSRHWGLAGLSLSMLLSSLGTSIANVALPTLASAFHAPFQQVQWVVLAYLLTITALIVAAGRLGDLMGRRRLLLAGIILSTLASVACAGAATLGWLIAARAVQGAGAAIMMALSLAFVAEAVPRDRVGSAMGLLGTMSAVGTALGPSLGGLLIAGFGWRSIFLVSVPLGVLAFVLIIGSTLEDRREAGPARGPFDLPGMALLAFALSAYALAMTAGNGSFGWPNAAFMTVAIVGAGLFVRTETRVSSPLVDLTMLRDPVLIGGLAMSTLITAVLMATLVVGPFYLSQALGLDAAAIGMVMSAGPLVAAITGVPAGRMVDRFGSHRMTIAGLWGVTAGCFAMSGLPTSLGVPGYIVAMMLMTSGYALFQAANNTGVMTGIDASRRGVVSALLNLGRNLGLITGASLMGAIFAVASGTSDISAAPREAVAFGMRITFAFAALLVLVSLAIALRSRAVAPREAVRI